MDGLQTATFNLKPIKTRVEQIERFCVYPPRSDILRISRLAIRHCAWLDEVPEAL